MMKIVLFSLMVLLVGLTMMGFSEIYRFAAMAEVKDELRAQKKISHNNYADGKQQFQKVSLLK